MMESGRSTLIGDEKMNLINKRNKYVLEFKM